MRYPIVTGATVALLGVLLNATIALAQEATPAATAQIEGQVAMPAHIHDGTCEQLGDVVYPLSNVGVPASSPGTPAAGVGASSTPAANASMVGSPDAIPVYVSVTQLDVSLDEILQGDRAINVHASEQDIQTYVACGNVGGTRYGDTIQFGLGELNNSGYTGVALLSATGEQRTNVLLYLTKTAPQQG